MRFADGSQGQAPGQEQESQDDRSVFVLSRPATRGQRRIALASLLAVLLFAAALVPFAREPLSRVTAFIVFYDAAIAVMDLTITAVLAGYFLVQRAKALLWLMGAYAFAGVMAVLHGLTFPGAFSATGWLGAGPQTTAWLYVAWHVGAALLILRYAVLQREAVWRSVPAGQGSAAAIALALALPVAVALLCWMVTSSAQELLPRIMNGDGDLPTKYVVVSFTMMLITLPLGVLLLRRKPSVLDLWLMVSVGSWLGQVSLESAFNHGRYSLGWYSGRVFGMVASLLLMIMLVMQDSFIHRRLVESLTNERRQRRLVVEGGQRLAQSQQAELQARHAALEARRSERRIRQLTAVRVEAREAERRRLARDLHDDLGQSLAAIRIRLQTMALDLAYLDGPVAERVEKVSRTIDAAQASLRQIVADLRPPLLDELGLVRSLRGLVEDFEDAHDVMCQLSITPPNAALEEPYATAVYRIVQEALTNVARHAHASRASVDFRVRDHAVELIVRDDGQAFDPALPVRSGAVGLASMRERTEELGGRFQIDSAPGRGTTIVARLPMQDTFNLP